MARVCPQLCEIAGEPDLQWRLNPIAFGKVSVHKWIALLVDLRQDESEKRLASHSRNNAAILSCIKQSAGTYAMKSHQRNRFAGGSKAILNAKDPLGFIAS